MAATKKRAKLPSLDEATGEALGELLVAWSAEAALAKQEDDVIGKLRASRVLDLLLDLRAVVAETT